MRPGNHRWLAVAAVASMALASQSTPMIARADDQPHDVVYTVQFDGFAPGTVATFMLNDTQTNSADLDVPPFTPFEARGQLTDAARAGIQLRLRWPSETTVHCQIQVDDIVAVKRSQYVRTWWKDPEDPNNGLMRCGAPISGYT